MADVQTLEQRFESITVQDENQDTSAPYQHKAKVLSMQPAVQNATFSHTSYRARSVKPSHYRISAQQQAKTA